MRIGQSKGGRVWKRIRSRKWFLMQIYEREITYKSGYDNLEISVGFSDVKLSSMF
jgi:hypothetical protein